ncbi:unnamed protein product [Tuber melanosporum]|jgi:plastocyanin/type II secretory pathway pseudopilin PulG|uniref:(Perigord truffle) hypothetical protein n=1 Tax=Tuber melanosporum (strain Mel28) TaxID=656061 RepID=D5GFF3_TUBMM|nr:uncharacterized protein GSTUM_00006867001 [Tuber melanosporum]CAZ83246.1 unnamed protein product [Tuber melanosporum]
MLRRLFAGAAIAVFAWWEVTALPSPQDPGSSSDGGNSTDHIVAVGKADHQFSPDIIIARPGDTITFQFYPLNHSVARMDPEYPCKPWEKIHRDGTPIWSGFHAMDTFLDPPPSYTIKINDTKPLWFYCSAEGSCIKYQMVMSINPDNNTSPIAKVKADAGKATFSLSPGEPWPAEGGDIPNPDGNSSTGGSNTGNNNHDDSMSMKLSPGAIAGIAIGGVIALALIGLLFFFVGRKKGTGEAKTGGQAASANLQEAALMNSQTPGPEYPPVYQDPRYSVLPAVTPVLDAKNSAPGEPPMSENPNRVSELGAGNYDPVEIYTAGPDETPAHRNN